jgi:hypothetical protein
MSHLSTGILASTAVALTLGAVQLASGRDLYDALQTRMAGPWTTVNRAVKADRAPRLAAPMMTRTVALRLDTVADTSILVRIPVALEVRNSPMRPPTNSGNSKPAVACEAVVSQLTEIAKQLQPGRCLT